MSDQEHPFDLQAFVEGRLSAEAEQAVLTHLATCDRCLSEVDSLWQNAPAEVAPRPPAPQGTEKRLLRRIHRHHLAGTLLRLSTGGVAHLLLALLSPLQTPEDKPPRR